MKGFIGIINLFVGMTIAVILVASVVLPQIATANQSGWDSSTIAIWGILGVVVVASLIGFVAFG